MRLRTVLMPPALVALLPLTGAPAGATSESDSTTVVAAVPQYDVWTLHQADTRPGYGGLLHVYDG